MDELYEVMANIFRNILTEDVIRGKVHWHKIPLDMLYRIYAAYYGTRDEEAEIRKKLGCLKDQVEYDQMIRSERDGFNVFLLIQAVIEDALIQVHGEVVCRFEKLPVWKKLTNKMDGDLLVAAKYAQIDFQNGKVRRTFAWKKVVGHNNSQLNTILENGISDNHFHLFSSVHYFELSWLSLMNRIHQPGFITKLEKLDRERRNPRIRLGKDYMENSYAVLHMQAALIRVYLYAFLTDSKIQIGTYTAFWPEILQCCFRHENFNCFLQEFGSRNSETQTAIEFDGERRRLKSMFPRILWILEYSGLNLAEADAEDIVNRINELRGSEEKVPLDDCGWILKDDDPSGYDRKWEYQTAENLEKLLKNEYHLSHYHEKLQEIINSFLFNADSYHNKDYAMNFIDGWYEQNEFTAVMAGERWLLYSMFRRLENTDAGTTEWFYDLFFAYLLIKEKFRMELLQNNDRIGFGNFKQYQERKSWFTTQYSAGEMARMAVDTAMEGQNIKSLEVRIKPENTFKQDAAVIRRYDKEIKKKGNSFGQYTFLIRESDGDHVKNEKENDNFYYVFHFSKRQDDIKNASLKFNHMRYRHQKLRAIVKQQTRAIIKLRKKNPEIAARLRGIDACSDEDGCRPEVFATAYRVLRNHSCYRGLSLSQELPQLRATYHVGEVFQDILDGLRAIDEAILFLNLDCGDRLGHATVLGMDAEKWYREKAYVITLRRQDYLDNIAWLYHQLIRYKAPGMDKLLQYLETEFQLQFSLIYEKNLEATYLDEVIRNACEYDKEYGVVRNNGTLKLEFNIHTYYYSWMLRGDHPQLYADGYYKRAYHKKDLWDEYSVNIKYPKEKRVRYLLPAVILNHYYHYNNEIKKIGNAPTTVNIPVNMAEGIAFVQKKLRQEIAERGIAIETNPTSNLLINRIKNYADHPIIRFFNKGLTCDPEQLENCEQINTSINTDNQGTFATSLSNEYALMACTLGELRDEKGNPIYKKANIYEWLQYIQEMGNNQSFIQRDE